MTKDKLFAQGKIGPLTIRNRTIRSAAFEGMCPNNNPSESLLNYHKSVASGGIGMTTIAYASITKNGLSFPHQLWLRREIIPELKKITDEIHKEGALASIQIGHCGNMADRKVTKERAVAPTRLFNLFGLVLPKALSENEILEMVKSYGDAVNLARESGFDAVEVHAGHGYLISQFLSPYTNRRKDKFGESLKNRYRFLKMIMNEVKKSAADDIAVIVKMNLTDGFKGGMKLEEAIQVAQMLEKDGADALVLSGGFVSKTPMYVMRGDIPLKEMISHINKWIIKLGLIFFGKLMIKTYPFKEAYFLEDALKIREKVKIPLILVGGFISKSKMEKALDMGFDFISIARALIIEPDLINKFKNGVTEKSICEPCNKCIGIMYSKEMTCPRDDLKKKL